MNVTGINATHGLTAAEIQPKAEALTPAQRVRASQLHGAALRNASPAEQRAAVASQFEAVLVRQLLGSSVTAMLGKQGGASASIYGDLITDTFAQKLTAGSGMGLARLIEQQLTPRGPALSETAPSEP